MFADDILLIAEASQHNTTTILDILDRFGACFGQQVNWMKSQMKSAGEPLGIAATEDLGSYLGLRLRVPIMSVPSYVMQTALLPTAIYEEVE